MHRRIKIYTPLFLLLLLPVGCSIFGAPEAFSRSILFVDSDTRECVGEGIFQCLLVKERPEDPWGLLYGGIIGFTYEAGYAYTLLVEKRKIDNPPADGFSTKLILIEIIHKEKEEQLD